MPSSTTASYRIIEKVRKAISSDYVTASDADVARALGISRATISAYKKSQDETGRMVMNPETLDRASQLCHWPKEEIFDYSIMLAQDAAPAAKLVWAAQRYILEQARKYSGKAAAFVLAILAAGMLYAPESNQALAGLLDDAGNIHYTYLE